MIAALTLLAAATLDSPPVWTQFRLAGSNNAVIRGSLQTSWTLKTHGPFSSSPTIAGGILYAGNNAGELYAIDPVNGKVRWMRKLANPLMSAPLVYGNVVIVGEGNEESPSTASPTRPIHVGTPPNALIAFDRATGALVWRRELQGSGMPTPAIIEGMLVQANGAGYLNGLNPLSGAVAYTIDAHTYASMSDALPFSGGRFAVTGIYDNAVTMYRARDGAQLWRASFSSIGSGIGDCPPATEGRRIYCNYVMPPSAAIPIQTERAAIMHAYAVDAATGKRVWDTTLETGELPIRNEASIPLLVNGRLYMGSSLAPWLHAMDPSTGRVLWRFRAHGVIKGGIVEAGGLLYFGDFGGYIWAVNAATGAFAGDVRLHVPFNVGSPIIAGGTLVIGAANGTLYALPLAKIRSSHDA